MQLTMKELAMKSEFQLDRSEEQENLNEEDNAHEYLLGYDQNAAELKATPSLHCVAVLKFEAGTVVGFNSYGKNDMYPKKNLSD